MYRLSAVYIQATDANRDENALAYPRAAVFGCQASYFGRVVL